MAQLTTTKLCREAVMRRADHIDAHIGTVIKRRRKTLGFSLRHLSRRTGINYSQLHGYERGEHAMAAHFLPAIALALALSISDFFKDA